MLNFLNRNADFFLGGEIGLFIVVSFFSFVYFSKVFLSGFFILMSYLI